MRARSARGRTLLEMAIGAALLVIVIGAAAAIAKASSGVAQSTNDSTTAAVRCDRALQLIGAALHKGSLATMKKLDNTTFADGQSGTGFKMKAVTGYTTTATLDTEASYHFDIVAGRPDGSLVQTQNGIDRVLVTGVTAFTVTRSGTLFTLDMSTRAGSYTDDRNRSVHATLQIATRNP